MSIYDVFINDFPIVKGNKSTTYLILFDAFTGQGKSYVSKIISKYDNSVIVNNDEVRNWLNDYNDKKNLKDKLQKYRLELLLKNNNSCIIDSCFSHNWKDKKIYYDKLGYKFYVIRLVCSDKVVKERLLKRNINNDDYSKGSYNDYMWMKKNVSNVDNNLIDYVINTEEDVEEQVLDFFNKYKLLGCESKNDN